MHTLCSGKAVKVPCSACKALQDAVQQHQMKDLDSWPCSLLDFMTMNTYQAHSRRHQCLYVVGHSQVHTVFWLASRFKAGRGLPIEVYEAAQGAML